MVFFKSHIFCEISFCWAVARIASVCYSHDEKRASQFSTVYRVASFSVAEQTVALGGLLLFYFIFKANHTKLTCATVYYGICTSTCLFIVM